MIFSRSFEIDEASLSVPKMVANAGIVLGAKFLDGKATITPHLNKDLGSLVTIEQMDAQYAVNVRGVFLCYKYAALQMIKQGRGGRLIG